LKLPLELSSRIYEFLLTGTRGPEDFVDQVILITDLNRRKEHRALSDTPALSTSTSKKSKAMVKRYHMPDENEITFEGFKKRICELPSLLETTILSVCQQTHSEGNAILFRKNVFAFILSMVPSTNNLIAQHLTLMAMCRIERLCLEIQLIGHPARGKLQSLLAKILLHRMQGLKSVRIVTTFTTAHALNTQLRFERFWYLPRYYYYSQMMRELITASSKGVELRAGI
jgi:hypothetical protein